jgi:hypothetical protein
VGKGSPWSGECSENRDGEARLHVRRYCRGGRKPDSNGATWGVYEPFGRLRRLHL